MLRLGYDDRKHCVKQFAAGLAPTHPRTAVPNNLIPSLARSRKGRISSLKPASFRSCQGTFAGINRREKRTPLYSTFLLTSPTSCVPEDLPIPWEPLKVKLPQYRTIYYDTGRHFAKLEIRFKLAARGSAPCTPGRPGKPLASPGRSKTCNYINSFDREGISKGHCSHLRRYYVGAVPFKGHFISVKIEYLSVSVRSCDHCKVRAICVPAMSALR